MQAQNFQNIFGYLSRFYNYARPAAVELMQNQQINQAVTSAALVALGAFGNIIGQWLGFYSYEHSSILKQLKSSFPGFSDANMTNTAEVVEKIKELAKNVTKLASIYKIVRKKSENLLQSSNTDNDVKKSLIKAGLNILPKLDLDDVSEIAVVLSDWINDSGICHEQKLLISNELKKGEQRELNKEKELSFCKKELFSCERKVRNLSVDDAVCSTREQICKGLLDKCENKGVLKRTFCWFN